MTRLDGPSTRDTSLFIITDYDSSHIASPYTLLINTLLQVFDLIQKKSIVSEDFIVMIIRIPFDRYINTILKNGIEEWFSTGVCVRKESSIAHAFS
jgi:hypothetical protein